MDSQVTHYRNIKQQGNSQYIAHYLRLAEAHTQPTRTDYDTLDPEKPNLLTAMKRAHDAQQWDIVRRLAGAIAIPTSGMLGVRGHWKDLQTCLTQALTATQKLGHRQNEAAFLHNLAILKQNTGDYATARQLYEQSQAIREELGDKAGLAASYHNLGALAQATGDYATARQLYEQSQAIREELGDKAGLAASYGQLAILAEQEGDKVTAERFYRQALVIAEELGYCEHEYSHVQPGVAL